MAVVTEGSRVWSCANIMPDPTLGWNLAEYDPNACKFSTLASWLFYTPDGVRLAKFLFL